MFKRQLGFNLIEVLIALFILSFGLLALAELQLAALRSVEEAYWQSVASVRMAAILERFRATNSKHHRQAECNTWQTINQQLSASLQSECQCQTNSCLVTLRWKSYSNHTLRWQAKL